MIDCTFHLDPRGKWQCSLCGWTYPLNAEKPPRRNCPSRKREPDPYPAAEAAWILTHICGGCAKFREATGTCHCGRCRIGFDVMARLRTGLAGCPGLKW